MSYAVKLDQFEGPLDALLQLVEAQQLAITDISLAQVTDPFVALIRERETQLSIAELADFLSVAARLVYLKAMALLPVPELLQEEGEIDLASQLRTYQQFVQLARELGARDRLHQSSYSRAMPMKVVVAAFSPPPSLAASALAEAYRAVLRRLEPETPITETTYRRVVTLEERITSLQELIRRGDRTSFFQWVGDPKDREAVVVSFLAVLELVKQRVIRVTQQEAFLDFDFHSL